MGPDHPDVGATCSDTADAIDFLLSAAPRQLFAAFPEWGDFSKASKVDVQLSVCFGTGILAWPDHLQGSLNRHSTHSTSAVEGLQSSLPPLRRLLTCNGNANPIPYRIPWLDCLSKLV